MRVFTRRAFVCDGCGRRVEDLYWEDQTPPPCCGTWHEGAVSRGLRRTDGVIDDHLDGGARWFEHLGPEPVWVESKSQLKRELAARGLENCSRHDRAYFDRLFRQHDERRRDEGRR